VPGLDAREMSYPAICRHCHHLHDAGKAETVQRYVDCSVWRCPRCKVLIDDRPPSWGGSLVGPDAVKAAAFHTRHDIWI
jgi:hypothetical protein